MVPDTVARPRWSGAEKGCAASNSAICAESRHLDDLATRITGEAFDAARKELHDTRRPRIVQEVMAKRIIDAARTRRGLGRPEKIAKAAMIHGGNARAGLEK